MALGLDEKSERQGASPMAPELFEPSALAALSEPLAVRPRAIRCTRPLTRHGSQTYNSGAIGLVPCGSHKI
jgi:hypothetical protein